MSGYSKEDLIKFLDWAGEKGEMKKGTTIAYKVACNAVLSVLEKDEQSDLSNVNLDSLFNRYENLNGMTSKTETMRTYKKRVADAIREFLAYRQNGASWKPSTARRSSPQSKKSSAGKDSRGAQDQNGNHPASVSRGGYELLGAQTADDPARKIEHLFPMRKDVIITISGIPFDVKKTEMGRLNAFLANLVAEGDEERPRQPMLLPPASN